MLLVCLWCLRLFQLAIATSVSAITNMAEGLSDVKLSHAQTLAAAELSKQNFINLICGFLRKIA